MTDGIAILIGGTLGLMYTYLLRRYLYELQNKYMDKVK